MVTQSVKHGIRTSMIGFHSHFRPKIVIHAAFQKCEHLKALLVTFFKSIFLIISFA